MSKITLGIYRILSVFVMLSMTFSMVGPVGARGVQSTTQADRENYANKVPYQPWQETSPYAALLKTAPLTETSLADLVELDSSFLLSMPDVPSPFAPQDTSYPFVVLDKLNNTVPSLTPNKLNSLEHIMRQAQEQLTRKKEFSLTDWWGQFKSSFTQSPQENFATTTAIQTTPEPEPIDATPLQVQPSPSKPQKPVSTPVSASETLLDTNVVNISDSIILAPVQEEVPSNGEQKIFYENTVSFNYEGGNVILYAVNYPNNLCTDDRVVINILHPDGSHATPYDWDYSEAGPGITCTGPVNLTSKFALGENIITIQLWDMIVPVHSSNGYQLGAGIVDNTPPNISIVEVWPDGQGNLAITAYVTDPESGVSSVTISGNGINNALMTYVGGNLYRYAFRKIPNGKIVDFTITATNAVDLTAMAKGSSRSPKSFDFSKWRTQCSTNTCGGFYSDYASGDPVPLSILNFVYEIPVMYLAGPGDSDIDFRLTYNSQNPQDGPYGQGMTGPNQMQLDLRNNELLNGVAVIYPDGHKVLFTDQGNNTFASASPGVFDQLKKQGDGYLLITRQVGEYEFNAAGQLTVVHDLNDNQIRFLYTGGQLTRIENDGGRWINLTYTGDKVTALDGPEGKHVEFGYTGPALTSYKDLRGQVWTFEYQAKSWGTLLDVKGQPYEAVDHWMTGVKTPKGHYSVKNVYNDKGEVVEQWTGEREHRKFSRNEESYVTTIVDAYDKTIQYTYDNQWRLIRVDYPNASYETFSYDDNFNRTFWHNRNGGEWHYTYDTRGNRLTEDGPLGYHREWQYHPTFNKPVSATEKVDASTSRTWTFGYDDKGNLVSLCNPYDCSSMTYNTRGLPETITDFAENVTTNTYDAEWDLATSANGEGETVIFGTDNAGRTVSITSPMGKTFHFGFDPADKLIAVDGPMGYHTGNEYDPNGNLSIQTDANGGQTVYTFDTSEKLVSIKNQNNITIASYEYGAMNEVSAFTDGEGRRWVYDNDTDQRMVGMHGPLGVNITFKRDALGNITEATDAEGRKTVMEYEALNRLFRVTKNPGAGGADSDIITSFEYNLVGDLLRTVDPDGNPTIYQYDLMSRMTMLRDAEQQETHFEYDKMGNLKLVTNPRTKTTQRTYDHANRLKTITGPLGSTFTYVYDKDGHLSELIDPLQVVTRYEYDDLGRLATLIQNYIAGTASDNQTNVTTKYQYDLAGNLKVVTDPREFRATYTYDPAFRLTDTFDFAGGHTHYVYDKADNLLSVTDGNDHTTQYTVDALDRVVKITNPQGHFVSFTYNKTGALTDVVDANENPTHFTLDKLDRVVNMKDALAGIWNYTYDRVGNILVESDANQHETTFTYDKVYRLLTSTDAEGNLTSFAWDANGNLAQLTDGNHNPTQFTYDDADQLIAVTNAENETTRYGYNPLGYQSQLIEADSTITLYGYDPLYRLASITENYIDGQPASNDTNVVTHYSYDASGNMEQFINANGKTTRFEHDGMGRLTKETNPLNNTWNYVYDPVGNLSSRVDANGKETGYSYFEDDQLRQISYFDGTTVKFDYDRNNNLIGMQDRLGASKWKYDALNRVTSVTDALKRTLGFAYDAVGNRTGITYPVVKDKKDTGLRAPVANRVTYSYLKNNWLESMTSPAGKTVYTRDHVGNLLSISNPNSTRTSMTYDKVNRNTHILNEQLVGAKKINSEFTYEYNDLGHVTSVTASYATPQGNAQRRDVIIDTYGYDGLHRLNSASRTGKQTSWKMSYTYDAVGNRTQWKTDDNPATQTPQDGFTATYIYNAANQLTSASIDAKKRADGVNIDYKYDPNGNRIDKLVTPQSGLKKGTSYAYDPENRLTFAQDYQIAGAGKLISRALTALDYDGMGRRLVQTYDPKTGNGGAKRMEYTFDGLDTVAEYSLWDGQSANYYRGAMGRIAVMHEYKSGTPGQMYFYDYNFKGDVVGLNKQSGQSIHTYQYEPYGGILPENGNFTDPHNHYTLTGKEYDENTGLFYFGARHYDPQSAQWMTQDSYRGETVSPLSMQRYGYVLDNPTTYSDFYGYNACQYGDWGGGQCKTWEEANVYCEGCVFGYGSSLYNAADKAVNSQPARFVYGFGSQAWNTVVGFADLAKKAAQASFYTQPALIPLAYMVDREGLKNYWQQGSNANMDAFNWASSHFTNPQQAFSQDVCKVQNFSSNIWNSLASEWKRDPWEFSGRVGFELWFIAITAGVGSEADAAKAGSVAGKTSELINAEGKGIQFAQKGISSAFRYGEFANMTTEEVAAGLKAGIIKAEQLPIKVVVRDGVTYTINNRSLMALRQAGLEPVVIENVTGNSLFEEQLTQRLLEIQKSGGQLGPDFEPVIRKASQ